MANSNTPSPVHLNDAGDVVAIEESITARQQLSTMENSMYSRTRASDQIMYLVSAEMARVENSLRNVANRLTRKVTETSFKRMMIVTWDCVYGFTTTMGRDNGENWVPDPLRHAKYLNPIEALDAIVPTIDPTKDGRLWPELCVFVFLDFDDFMKDPRVRTRLIHMSARQRLVTPTARHPLFIVSAVGELETKLKPYISVFDVPLPDSDALRDVIDFITNAVRTHNKGREIIDVTPDRAQLLADNLAGMTSLEAENVLSRCFLDFGNLTHPEVLRVIREEKAMIVRKSDVLTYIPENSIANMENLRGFEGYVKWLRRRKKSYGARARELKIDTPRGVVVIGVPGTGKSDLAKATCRELDLPGYMMDFSAIFGSKVGESEQRMRDVLRIISAQQGCVLVIDEADKVFSNMHKSGGDSGVSQRVFGTFLTWLAENRSRVFVIMTLNRTDGIPPEMLRTGRFDKTFYTDLPTAEIRKQIISVQFAKRDVDINAVGLTPAMWDDILEKTSQFVGSELEEAAKESRHMSLADRDSGVPTPDELMLAISEIRPMASTAAESIREMQEFSKTCGTPVTDVPQASSEKLVKPPRKGRGRVVALDDDSDTPDNK